MTRGISRRKFIKYGASVLALLPVAGCSFNQSAVHAFASEAELPEINLIDCDYLIHRGLIVDGTGSEPYIGDIAIKGDSIIKIAKFIAGKNCEVIDARGKIVAPGFIDIHTHTEDYMIHNGKAEMILMQGVTTQIGGNCGTSQLYIGPVLEKLKNMSINFGMFSGYKEIRRSMVGNQNVRINGSNMQKMLDVLEQNMKDGAFGLSIGLEYWPQNFAGTEEIIELASLLSEYGGFYSTHLRSESDKVIEALEEAIEIGFKANVPVQYSHVKAAHKKNWNKMDRILNMLQEAKRSGLDITADVYGYTFSSNDLAAPNYHSMSEENLQMALCHQQVMIGSDSGLRNNGHAIHPRAYGNYPRILGQFVREKQLLKIEEAIHKMTGMPAKRLNLKDRGILKENMKADVVVFDLSQISDQATRQNTNVYSKGVDYVLVNGKISIKNGEYIDSRAGVVLRNNMVG